MVHGEERVSKRPLAEGTWESVRVADPSRIVVVLPVGAMEAHGPHLPLSTDVIIADAMARVGVEMLEARGTPAAVLPSLAYTAAPFAAGFPGTISVRPDTVTALVLDIARSVAGQGFRALAIANSHLDPAHLSSLGAAWRACREEKILPCAFPDLTRKPWALRLGEEFKTGACHAGRYESSVVMAERPDLVDEEARKALPPNPASLSEAIQAGKRTFAEADGPQAYFGWPADATVEEGREMISTLGEILADAVSDVLGEAPIAP